jgi:hypothetical protein
VVHVRVSRRLLADEQQRLECAVVAAVAPMLSPAPEAG